MMPNSSKGTSHCFIENYCAYGSEEKKIILWNNKDITIEQKMLFWKSWFEQGIYFVATFYHFKSLMKNLE